MRRPTLLCTSMFSMPAILCFYCVWYVCTGALRAPFSCAIQVFALTLGTWNAPHRIDTDNERLRRNPRAAMAVELLFIEPA